MTELWDLDAESRVLGSCLQAGRLIGVAASQLAPTDFYRPSHRWLYATLVDLYADGRVTPDPFTAASNEIKNQKPSEGPDLAQLLDLQISSPGTSDGPFGESVRQILRYSVARQMATIGGEIRQRAKAGDDTPDELVDFAHSLLASVTLPVEDAGQVPNLSTVDGFLETVDTRPTPWIVPGLLREGWRCMIVAAEGAGKSVATRQLAICAAQGIHPFAGDRIPPVRTLIVDLENPDDAIAASCKPIVTRARFRVQSDYEPGRAWLWRQPGGIDLRARVGRGRLEAVIAATQPDLVCLGPIYKAYKTSARESDELAASEVQATFDDLRTRYGFALVLEHHAPKAQGGYRELLPYGSSLWLRWPELGIKFQQDPDKTGSVKVGRFRQDRVEAAWPDRLDRGGQWPWTGFWQNPVEIPA